MTAEEFFKETSPNDEYGLRAKLITLGMERMIYEIMVRFARLKGKEILEAAAENATISYEKDPRHPSHWFESIDKYSILNSYDLNSII